MTDVQKVKKYLLRIRYIDKEIDAKQKVADMLRARTQSIKITKSKEINVQESLHQSFEDKIIQYMAMQEEISDKIDDLIALRQKVLEEIDHMDHTLHKSILIRRYVISESWEEISEELKYEKRQILRLHGNALKEFYLFNDQQIDKFFMEHVTKCR